MQFLAKNIFSELILTPSHPILKGVTKHGFTIQHLTFDVIQIKNLLVNWPHSSSMRNVGLGNMKICVQIWTCYAPTRKIFFSAEATNYITHAGEGC